eukprot:TRINITY_DN11329_c0_g1_i3.p1 TRINITY_DN11329_c0_g1~~TRINITY_DN11329_c0_g1_i3.p1  ORF type:complete len:116 (-),score=5.48 TRINITY_DN11329_c0_g1_i3:1425-1772(-)
MDQFNQSQGFLFHLNRDSINQKGSNQRRNVLNFGFNFGKKNVEFTVGALYWDLFTQQVGPISLLKYVIQVGPHSPLGVAMQDRPMIHGSNSPLGPVQSCHLYFVLPIYILFCLFY